METGTKVSGLYLGDIPFTGTIISRRNVTTDNHSVEHIVQLDYPVMVYETYRDRLTLITKENGSACSYSRHPCSMKETVRET